MAILDEVIEVFNSIASWFPTFMSDISAIFWSPTVGEDPGKLTFFGVLAVTGLGISVIFLVIGVISNFLHFRG